MRRNFWLDVLLLVSGLICIATGIMIDFHLVGKEMDMRRLVKHIHTYSGYVMAVAIIFHIAWHSGWIRSAFKQIFLKK